MHTSKRRKLPANVWLLCFVSFFADISSEMMYPLLPLFVIGVLGANEIQLGAMEGAAVLLVSLMSAYAGIRSDRSTSTTGRTRWLHWGYGLPVFGKTLIAFATSWGWIFAGRMFDRFGKGLRGAPRDALIVDSVPSDQRGEAFGLHRALDTAGALVADVAPKSHRGTAMGIYYALTGIASLVSSVLTGWIWHQAGSATALLTSAAFALVALALLATHRHDPRSEANPTLP